MQDQAGQEYWAAMNLMGDYAAANHAVIHKNVSRLLGAEILAGVENHHNFAWKERHGDKDLYVHRKGATPAGKGVLGVIPGSMADPAFVVRGKGGDNSFDSASHGAGRRMSRTAAFSKYNFRAVQKDLEAKGVHILSAGADEVPGVYKNILEVMAEQSDLVDVVARFDPKIVKMCGDGSKAED
jgi:tRNA-splicing ligase RtcB